MPGPVLTDFGRAVIARMNELGIVLDTAHASEASARAIVEASRKPVIDSHTTSRDLVPSSRGHSDETLKMIAKSGGVVGVHFADHLIAQSAWRTKYSMLEADGLPRSGFKPRVWEYNRHLLGLTSDPDERNRLRRDERAQEAYYLARDLSPDPPVPPVRAATVSQLADVTDYLVGVVGIEHVGIGGDVNGIDDHQWPEGMDHLGQLPHLTVELLSRGYKRDALERLFSANWLRVYAACLPA
jgi:membrane dipeptidase